MLFNNIDDGYLEGILRGFRGGVLTSADYANLCQCESIDGTLSLDYLPPLPVTVLDPVPTLSSVIMRNHPPCVSPLLASLWPWQT
jgi:V-type H+-transporting ATPase subunit d